MSALDVVGWLGAGENYTVDLRASYPEKWSKSELQGGIDGAGVLGATGEDCGESGSLAGMENRRTVPPFRSISKSEIKTLGCEYHYSAYKIGSVERPIARFTRTGTEFHTYRQVYVEHLMTEMLTRDEAWASQWLETAGFSDDGYVMIKDDIETFSIFDPDRIYGCEVFLCIDKDFNPIPDLPFPGVGRSPDHPNAYAHGTIDRLELDGENAWIDDYKTNRSETTLDPYEAQHYALLVFCNFPQVQTVGFSWELIRLNHEKKVEYHREKLDDLKRSLRDAVAKRADIAERWSQGEELPADPLAGICAYCSLLCPVRSAASRGEVVQGPIQTDDDVLTAAGTLVAIRSVVSQIEHQLRVYVDASGPVELPNGYEVALRTSQTRILKLRDVLGVIGVVVPELSPRFDVKLDSLRVGSAELKSLAKAQKRAGLNELLNETCSTKPRTELKGGKKKKPRDGDTEDE